MSWYLSDTWNYVGKVRRDFISGLGLRGLLFNRQNARIRLALAVLELVLDLIGSSNPVFTPNPNSVERHVITKDTENSLRLYFDINRNVVLSRLGNDYIVAIRAGPSLIMRLLISCNRDCHCYVDQGINAIRRHAGDYFQIVTRALSILSGVFNVDVPRVLLSHNPTVFGKTMVINNEEVITLSIWDMLRVINVLGKDDYTTDDIGVVIDTLVHEFLHYLLDKRYLVSSMFMEMTKRIPSVLDDGVIHELIAWSLTPYLSRYVAQCIKYGKSEAIDSAKDYLIINYPARRRHVIIARRVISELLSRLNGDCGSFNL
ncbi:MAG: hypothetical protein ACP5NQ_01735 [Vulcanisaeta sp.]